MGLNSLPDGLCEIAKIRLQYPDTPLKDLGTMLSVPLGKSGVNHRLRKISQIADSLREKNGMAPGGISNDNENHEI